MDAAIFRLDELIDFEARFERDRGRPEQELQQREDSFKLRRPLPAEAATWTTQQRSGVLREWLAFAWTGEERPGPLLYQTLSRTLKILTAAGLVVGVSAMRAVLYYNGATPINVVNAIGIFVGLQLAILAVLIVHLMRGEGLAAKRSLLHEMLRIIAYAQAKRASHPNKIELPSATVFRTAFGKAETWLVIRATQAFGIAFNVGALACGFYLITFTDLAFAWATTLQLDSSKIHALTNILSAPFAFIEGARPSLTLIEATRYFRFDGRYTSANDQIALAGEWWPFLFGCIVTYGLLPRMLLFVTAHFKYQAHIRYLSPSHTAPFEFEALWRRLTRSPMPDSSSNFTVPSANDRMVRSETSADVIAWRDLPGSDADLQRLLSSELGFAVTSIQRAGGSFGDLDASQAGQKLQNPQKQGYSGATKDQVRILILVDAFASFDKALQHFLRGLRRHIEPTQHIAILLVEAHNDNLMVTRDDTRIALWRKSAAAVGDRYLGVML